MTLFEAMDGCTPSISFLHVFVCRCFIKNNRDQLTKFQPKAEESIFLEYSSKSKADRVLNRQTCEIEESFDVIFNDIFVQNSSPTHVTTHIMESDAPPDGSPNSQIIHEADFESLFEPLETALDLLSRSRPSSSTDAPNSQNVSGPTPTFPPFDSDLFQLSQVEGENSHPTLK